MNQNEIDYEKLPNHAGDLGCKLDEWLAQNSRELPITKPAEAVKTVISHGMGVYITQIEK